MPRVQATPSAPSPHRPGMRKRPTYLAQGRAQTNLGKEKDIEAGNTTKLDGQNSDMMRTSETPGTMHLI